MRPEIVKAVADRVANAEKSDVLLLDSVSLDDTTNPYEIPAPRKTELTIYLPAWVCSYTCVAVLPFLTVAYL